MPGWGHIYISHLPASHGQAHAKSSLPASPAKCYANTALRQPGPRDVCWLYKYIAWELKRWELICIIYLTCFARLALRCSFEGYQHGHGTVIDAERSRRGNTNKSRQLYHTLHGSLQCNTSAIIWFDFSFSRVFLDWLIENIEVISSGRSFHFSNKGLAYIVKVSAPPKAKQPDISHAIVLFLNNFILWGRCNIY